MNQSIRVLRFFALVSEHTRRKTHAKHPLVICTPPHAVVSAQDHNMDAHPPHYHRTLSLRQPPTTSCNCSSCNPSQPSEYQWLLRSSPISPSSSRTSPLMTLVCLFPRDWSESHIPAGFGAVKLTVKGKSVEGVVCVLILRFSLQSNFADVQGRGDPQERGRKPRIALRAQVHVPSDWCCCQVDDRLRQRHWH
jgi:hypothetical protein